MKNSQNAHTKQLLLLQFTAFEVKVDTMLKNFIFFHSIFFLIARLMKYATTTKLVQSFTRSALCRGKKKLLNLILFLGNILLFYDAHRKRKHKIFLSF